MRIFDTLFYTNENTSTVKIELNNEGIFINGNIIAFPTTITKLSETFGEPSRRYHDKLEWNFFWDNYGVYTKGYDNNIIELNFLLKTEKRLNHLPNKPFDGTIFINGESCETIEEKFIKVNKYELRKFKFSEERRDKAIEITCYNLGKNYDYKEEKDYENYKPKKIQGEKINFTDFNFKLAIIDELMYSQEVLEPKFDIYEFADLYSKRKIDIDEEGYEPIPEAIEYFKNLEIDKKYAELVTEICQNGNEIYLNIIPFWSGTTDDFYIESFEDIKHFPNLKQMTLFNLDSEVYDDLKARGIDAEKL